MIKTNWQVKGWIDEREALTKRELGIYIHGGDGHGSNPRVNKWWDYVLETKDWKKLNEYKRYKQTGFRKNQRWYNKVKEIYDKDKTIQNMGVMKASQLLKNTHKINLHLGTICEYLNEIRQK